MTILRPRIAIPEPTSTDEAYNNRSLPQYVGAIEAAGGVAVTIPLQQPCAEQAALLGTCAGILLPGSPADVDPTRYGQQPVAACAAKDSPREATDDLLLQNAFAQGKPLLGICFGLQSLNVWRHGSLIQDLPGQDLPAVETTHKTAEPTAVNHQPGREVLRAHPVKLNAESRLAQIVAASGEELSASAEFYVNSSHHQAIHQPGSMLRVAARSASDGVIEALETTDQDRFAVAVQWHPERSYQHSPASRAIFSAFLDAARAWGGASGAESDASAPNGPRVQP